MPSIHQYPIEGSGGFHCTGTVWHELGLHYPAPCVEVCAQGRMWNTPREWNKRKLQNLSKAYLLVAIMAHLGMASIRIPLPLGCEICSGEFTYFCLFIFFLVERNNNRKSSQILPFCVWFQTLTLQIYSCSKGQLEHLHISESMTRLGHCIGTENEQNIKTSINRGMDMYSSMQNVQCTEEKHFCNTMSPCFQVWQPSLVLWWAAPSFTDSAGFQLPCDLVLPTLPSSIFRAELPGPWQHNPSSRAEAQHLCAHLKCPG